MELVYGPFGRRKGNETANLIILLETSILVAAENNANNNFPIPNGSPQFGASSSVMATAYMHEIEMVKPTPFKYFDRFPAPCF
jgi:hypothetical protein